MRKKFNDTGVCVAHKHFMVDTSRKVKIIYEKYISQGEYFTINRSRQFGKTTTISLVEDYLNSKEDYLTIRISFEGIGDIFQTKEEFSSGFLKIIYYRIKNQKPEIAEIFKKASEKVHNFTELSNFITDFTSRQTKKVVLIIDEVDKSSGEQVFLHFLGLLRDKYLLQNEGSDTSFHSVILSGVNDIKTLKPKIRKNEVKQLNSPWNIATDFTVDLSFKPPEIETMLSSYMQERNVLMNKNQIAERLYYYTNGYPFLVSKLCKFIDEDILPERENQTQWTINEVEDAFKKIVAVDYKTTLFDSLFKYIYSYKKLEELLKNIVIDGQKISFSIYNEVIIFAHDFSIIRNENDICLVHNRIFEKKLYDYFISVDSTNKTLKKPQFQPDFYIEEDLNLPFILQKFQEFVKENYSTKDLAFYEREGRLLFLSFMKPILNGRGFDFKEPTVGDERRMDLVITYNNKRYVIELKVWRGKYYHQKGLKQLSNYLDYYALREGFLLIYDFRKEKIFKEEQITFENKNIFAVWV